MADFYCDEVLSSRTKVNVLVERERVLAFEHTRPAYRDRGAHVVVVPKVHALDLLEANPDLLQDVLDLVRDVARRIVGEYGAARVITNLGGYQDSKHSTSTSSVALVTASGPVAHPTRPTARIARPQHWPG